jgi:hypothetical protein
LEFLTMTISGKLLLALRSLNGSGTPSPMATIAKDLLLGDLYRRGVIVTITGVDATGGSTTATIEVNAKDHQNKDLDREHQIMLRWMNAQYDPAAENANATLSKVAAEAGSIIATAAGWALVETDATGKFEGTLTNASDETVFVSANTAQSGVSDTAKGAVVIASESETVVWSA